MRTYQQMSLEEWVTLQTQLQMGWSPAAIAAGLQRALHHHREMARNGWKPAGEANPQNRRWGNGMYLALTADRRARHCTRSRAWSASSSPAPPYGTSSWATCAAA